MTLKALSIRQPWIDLILNGSKTLELRRWNPSTRGLIALHASSTIDFYACNFYGFREPWNLHRGKILGVAKISEVFVVDESNAIEHLKEHLYVLPLSGPSYGIRLTDVTRLSDTIQYRGRLGVFDLNEATSELITSQLPTL